MTELVSWGAAGSSKFDPREGSYRPTWWVRALRPDRAAQLIPRIIPELGEKRLPLALRKITVWGLIKQLFWAVCRVGEYRCQV